jgi:hypothetical protein
MSPFIGAALLFAFLRLFVAVDFTLLRREGAAFCFLVGSGDMGETRGESGSDGLRGPAGIVGVGAASKAV